MGPISPRTGTHRRQDVIERVAGMVLKDRQNTYSDAEDNFDDIALRWFVYFRRRFPGFNHQILPQDVAALMADVKLSRIANNPWHQDNWDDLAGYGVCGGGIAQKYHEGMSAQMELAARQQEAKQQEESAKAAQNDPTRTYAGSPQSGIMGGSTSAR